MKLVGGTSWEDDHDHHDHHDHHGVDGNGDGVDGDGLSLMIVKLVGGTS